MSYEVIKVAAKSLPLKERLKLAQYLIQSAITEDETINPEVMEQPSKNTEKQTSKLNDKELLIYAKERLAKSKPAKIHSMKNFISAMFQFQGGIADSKVDEIISSLEKQKVFTINGTKIHYA